MAVLAYWEQVHRQEADLQSQGLGDVIHLMSLDTPAGGRAGMMTQATPRNAAICLTRATHRLATPAEIAQWQAAQTAAHDAAAREAESKNLMLALMPEIVGALRQRAAAPADQKKK